MLIRLGYDIQFDIPQEVPFTGLLCKIFTSLTN